MHLSIHLPDHSLFFFWGKISFQVMNLFAASKADFSPSKKLFILNLIPLLSPSSIWLFVSFLLIPGVNERRMPYYYNTSLIFSTSIHFVIFIRVSNKKLWRPFIKRYICDGFLWWSAFSFGGVFWDLFCWVCGFWFWLGKGLFFCEHLEIPKTWARDWKTSL